MGNKKATGFLCLRLVPCFAYVGAEDNRKGIPFVKIVSLLCKLIQFLMVALSVTVHKALILLVFLNHPYQSLAFTGFLVSAQAWAMEPVPRPASLEKMPRETPFCMLMNRLPMVPPVKAAGLKAPATMDSST